MLGRALWHFPQLSGGPRFAGGSRLDMGELSQT
jgi:hypothetical protein